MRWNRQRLVKLAAIFAGAALLGTAAALVDDARSDTTLGTLAIPDEPAVTAMRPAILRPHPTTATIVHLAASTGAISMTRTQTRHHPKSPHGKGRTKHHRKSPHHGHHKK
ncbi:hypothetical protein [Nonomuraea sediminis]|uniref:hypothetical protein n=1 Tax=Nonomuraea sediminis TaxID=2835864 RepID=UPI001BDC9B50|nr:hypothetical protein [Nonomuraea sediminis]